MSESAAGGEPSPGLRSVLEGHAGRGSPLPDTVRETLEPRYGADLSDVRVHHDGEAHRMATGLGARAFTYGSDIYFREGAYDPAGAEGRHTLDHEVAHTLQQDDGRPALQREVVTGAAAEEFLREHGADVLIRGAGSPTPGRSDIYRATHGDRVVADYVSFGLMSPVLIRILTLGAVEEDLVLPTWFVERPDGTTRRYGRVAEIEVPLDDVGRYRIAALATESGGLDARQVWITRFVDVGSREPDAGSLDAGAASVLERSERLYGAYRHMYPVGGRTMTEGDALGAMAEGSALDARLAAEGLSREDYRSALQGITESFRDFAIAWACKLLDDSTLIVRRERERYAAGGPDVDELWSALAPARAVAPEEAALERMASMARGTEPDAISESAVRWLVGGGERSSRPEPRSAVARERGRISAERFPIVADPDLDARLLSNTSRDEFQDRLVALCDRRLRAIRSAREGLASDPDRVWGLDVVIEMAIAALHLPPNGTLERAIRDGVAEHHASSEADFFGLVAMLFGLLTGAGGVLAAIGTIGSIAAGVYAALSRYEEFEWSSAVNETAFDRARALSSAADPEFIWVVVEVASIVPDVLVGGALIRAIVGPAGDLVSAYRLGRTGEAEIEAIRRTATDGVAAVLPAAEAGSAASTGAAIARRVAARARRVAAREAALAGAGPAADALRARGLTDAEAAGVIQLSPPTRAAAEGFDDAVLRVVGEASERSPMFRRGMDALVSAVGDVRFREIVAPRLRLRSPDTELFRRIGEAGLTPDDVRAALSDLPAGDGARTFYAPFRARIEAARNERLAARALDPPAPGEIASPLRGSARYESDVLRRGTLDAELEAVRDGWTGADEARFRGLPEASPGDSWHLTSVPGGGVRLDYQRGGVTLDATSDAIAGPAGLPAPEPGYRYMYAPGRTPPFRVRADPTPTAEAARPQREVYRTPSGAWDFRDVGGRLLDSSRLRRNLERLFGRAAPDAHQAHHLVPSEVVRDHDLFRIAREQGYNGDRASNGIFLPETDTARVGEGWDTTSLPLHNTSHETYNDLAFQIADDELSELIETFGMDALASRPAEVEAAVRRVEAAMEARVRSWGTGRLE